MADTPDAQPTVFRLVLVPGMQPTSWTRTWTGRLPDVRLDLVHLPAAEAAGALTADHADAALLRLPVDRDLLHAIPLFVEDTVVVLPRDHLLTALDEAGPEDLAEETLLVPADDVLGWGDPPGRPFSMPAPPTTADAVELVAAGVGLLVVPLSLARLHHRKDLTHRPLRAAPTSQAALAWSRTRTDDPLVEELIGIVRGRSVNSSRGRGAPADDGDGARRGADSPAGRDGDRGGRGRQQPRAGGSGGRPARGGGPARGSRGRGRPGKGRRTGR